MSVALIICQTRCGVTLGLSGRTVGIIIILILVVVGGYGGEIICTMIVIFMVTARVTAYIKGYINIVFDMLHIWSICVVFPIMVFVLSITIGAVVRGVIAGMISFHLSLVDRGMKNTNEAMKYSLLVQGQKRIFKMMC